MKIGYKRKSDKKCAPISKIKRLLELGEDYSKVK